MYRSQIKCVPIWQVRQLIMSFTEKKISTGGILSFLINFRYLYFETFVFNEKRHYCR